ncbi:MAG: thioredoxin, partial [Alistipes sp.]|nr:thioredoxin [Alistipes sp.]
ANESSPEVTYKTTIADIMGLHYRLNGEQWTAITTDKFNIDGIPSYVVVDKDGKYALRNDLRDTNKMGRDLLKMTEK